jgi:hypothetical protein
MPPLPSHISAFTSVLSTDAGLAWIPASADHQPTGSHVPTISGHGTVFDEKAAAEYMQTLDKTSEGTLFTDRGGVGSASLDTRDDLSGLSSREAETPPSGIDLNDPAMEEVFTERLAVEPDDLERFLKKSGFTEEPSTSQNSKRSTSETCKAERDLAWGYYAIALVLLVATAEGNYRSWVKLGDQRHHLEMGAQRLVQESKDRTTRPSLQRAAEPLPELDSGSSHQATALPDSSTASSDAAATILSEAISGRPVAATGVDDPRAQAAEAELNRLRKKLIEFSKKKAPSVPLKDQFLTTTLIVAAYKICERAVRGKATATPAPEQGREQEVPIDQGGDDIPMLRYPAPVAERS